MDNQINLSTFDFQSGDHVILVDDKWDSVGSDIVLVDAEPVPGSTQCVVRIGNETHTVSRGALRHAA